MSAPVAEYNTQAIDAAVSEAQKEFFRRRTARPRMGIEWVFRTNAARLHLNFTSWRRRRRLLCAEPSRRIKT
jgi:hypothetical protein